MPSERSQNQIVRQSGVNPSSELDERADVLIVTAVKSEWDAALAVDTGSTHGSHWKKRIGSTGLEVAFREFEAVDGVIRIAVTQALGLGGTNAVIAAAQLLKEYDIRCLAMCGVCAGRRSEVALGDVIIADRLWEYDTGKLKVEVVDGARIRREQSDIEMYRLHPASWRQAAERFTIDRSATWLALRPRSYEAQGDWILERILKGIDPAQDRERSEKCASYDNALARLWRKNLLADGTLKLTDDGRKRIERLLLLHHNMLPEQPPLAVLVGPIASGAKVIEDEQIFSRLADPVRKVLGVEMEAAAIGALAYTQGLPYSVVMKAAMDHADSDKNDNFKAFAARASAEVLVAFLRQNMPPRRQDSRPHSPNLPQGKELESATNTSAAWRAMCSYAAEVYHEYETKECYIRLHGHVQGGHEEKSIDLERYVERCIASKSKAHLALLGDYGSGKTLFCQRLAANIGKQYLENKSQLVPLVVPLRGLHKAANLKSFIEDQLAGHYGISISHDELHKKLRNGELLVILDGLDELSVVVEEYARIEILEEALDYLRSSRIGIITCRTHFFESQQETDKRLGTLLPDSLIVRLRANLLDKTNYKIVHVNEFDPADISKYIQFYWHAKAAEVMKQITAVHDLMDLAKRPILLRLIKDTWEFLPKNAEINRLLLYHTYVAIWWDREETRLVIPKEELESALMHLAFQTVSRKKDGISLRDLHSLLPSSRSSQKLPEEAIGRCMATCTFLNRDGLGVYRFIHRSFAEYFASKEIVRELEYLDFSSFSRARHDMGLMPANLARFIADHLRESPLKGVVVRHLLRFLASQVNWKLLHGWLERLLLTLLYRIYQFATGYRPSAYFPPFSPGLRIFHGPCQVLMALGDVSILQPLYKVMRGAKGNAWHTISVEDDSGFKEFTIEILEQAIIKRKSYTFSI